MSTPTPDYGEPWRDEIMGGIVGRTDDFMVLPYMDYEGLDWDSERFRDRAITCVNALAGVPDPAAEIARLREALNNFDAIDKERNDALKTCMTLLENMHANRNQHKVAAYTDEIEAAIAKIQTCYDPHA